MHSIEKTELKDGRLTVDLRILKPLAQFADGDANENEILPLELPKNPEMHCGTATMGGTSLVLLTGCALVDERWVRGKKLVWPQRAKMGSASASMSWGKWSGVV